jgi:flagellar protein FliS
VQNAYISYAENEILTADPEKLVLLMYQGAIKFIRQARLAIAEKRVEDAHNTILRAYAIVAELMATLDKERGGEIATNLERCYEFMLSHLRSADAVKDDKLLYEVESLLVPLAETWEAAFFKNGARIARKTSGPDTYKPFALTSIDERNGGKPQAEQKPAPSGDYARLNAYGKREICEGRENNGSGDGAAADEPLKSDPPTVAARKPGKLDLRG